MPVDTTLKYRGYNSYLMAEGGEILYSDPFDVSLFSDVVAQLSAIKLGGTASLFVSFKFFDEENKIITPPDPVWTIDIIDRWTDYWRTIPVPSSAKTMQWRIQSVGWSKHIACPKISAGTMPTAFSDEATIRESYLTAEGLYTSTVSADQVIAGILRATSGKAWFDLEKPEIVMKGDDGTKLISSPGNPLRIEDADGDLIGGLLKLGDQLRMIAGALANSEEAKTYLEVGKMPDEDGYPRDGVRVVYEGMPNGSSILEMPAWAGLDGVSKQLMLTIFSSKWFRLLFSGREADLQNATLTLGPATFFGRASSSGKSLGISVGANTYKPTLSLSEDQAELQFATGSAVHGIGVDGAGPYRIKSGTKTYF